MDATTPWRRLSSRTALKTKTFAVKQDEVELPGKGGQTMEYSYLERADGVIVVPMRDANEVLMVEQYRYPIRSASLEFPAGLLDEGEDPEEAARRELVEELGVEAAELAPVGAFFQNAAVLNARSFVFLARGLRDVGAHREATEIMESRPTSFAAVEGMIRDGRVSEAATICSYFLAKRFLDTGSA